MTEAAGIPIGLATDGANRNDCKLAELTIASIPIERPPPTEERPQGVCLDKAYDHAFIRRACRERGVKDRIARRGVDSSERLGRHRWVVERAFAHLGSLRRLGVRWERKAEHWRAFALLGCALLCLRRLVRHLGL